MPSEAAPADSPDKALLTTRSTQRLVLPGLWLSPIAILQKQSEHQTHTDLCVTTCAVFCLEFTSVQLVTAAPLPVGQHTATQQFRRARLGRPSALIDQASVPESEETLEGSLLCRRKLRLQNPQTKPSYPQDRPRSRSYRACGLARSPP